MILLILWLIAVYGFSQTGYIHWLLGLAAFAYILNAIQGIPVI